VPPTERFVISFAAEPPQDAPPYGRWADTLGGLFREACHQVESEDGSEPGEPGEIAWIPDRTFGGRTYVPATSHTESGHEYFGYVSYARAEDGETVDFRAVADVTDETASANPDWQLDLSDEVIGTWRGEQGRTAAMTLIWGVPIVGGGAIVTAELADLAVDQCELAQGGRFTLLAADAYRGDYLDIKLWSGRGELLATESLYVEDDEE
jgi:hypothetical protein